MMFSSTILGALILLPWQTASPAAPEAQTTRSEVRGVRKRMLGRIVQKDGSAWAGAEVRLISWPDWNHPGIGEFDDLRVVTDARGRFSVKGLQHRRYYIWAWQRDGDTAYRISEPGRYVVPGQPFVLEERARRSRRHMLEVDLSAWSRFGPFRIALRENPFVGPYATGVSRQLDLLAWLPTDLPVGKKVELPVLPWPQVRVECLGRGGMLLYHETISLLGEDEGITTTKITPSKGRQYDARFYLDPQMTRRAKGYKLHQRYMGRMIDLDAVDDDGQGRILLPAQARNIHDRFWHERGPWYVGRLEGRAEGADYLLDRSTRVGAGRGLRVRGILGVLEESHPIQIEVHCPGGKPLAGLPILIWQRQRTASLRRMVHVLPMTMGQTDARGRFSWPWFSKEEYAIFAILPDHVLDQLMGGNKVPIHPMVLLTRGLGIDVEGTEPRILSLEGLQEVTFDVAWDKEKVRQAPNVNLFSPVADAYGYVRLLRLPSDLRGRVRALLPPAQQLPYLARSLLGVVTGTVTTRVAAEVSDPIEIPVRIPDAVEISGVVRDEKGLPVPSASVNLANPWFRSRGQHPLLRFDVSRISVLTDEKGRFRIFQEKVQAPLQLQVSVFKGSRQISRRIQALDPSERLTGIKIEVNRPGVPGANKPGVVAPGVRRVPVKKR